MKEIMYPNIYDALSKFLANKEVDIYSDLRSLAENLIDSIDNKGNCEVILFSKPSNIKIYPKEIQIYFIFE